LVEYGSGPLPPHPIKIRAAQAGANMDMEKFFIRVAFFKTGFLLAKAAQG
jgi:hypothetical protein